MNDKDDKPQAKAPAEEELKTSVADNLEKEKNKTDTAPDEFLSPRADTDQPVDGQVLNDAALRGEPYHDNPNVPPPVKEP